MTRKEIILSITAAFLILGLIEGLLTAIHRMFP